MATVMMMIWPGINREHYDAIRREVDFERNVPKGGKYHVAWQTAQGMHVVDVWDSQATFEQFLTTNGMCLMIVVLNTMMHRGQVADARRALGRKPLEI